MSERSALVSVIIPSYNHSKYIERCICSVIEQSYENIQLIVVDDGSSDGSGEIITSLSGKYNFVFEIQKNQGLSRTLNTGIRKYATGEYICCLASDDYWHKDKIKKQVEFMESHPECGMVCSQAYVVDKDGSVTGTIGDDIRSEDLLFENILVSNKVPALTVMLRKSCIDVVGNFDETLFIEDWDMWIRVSEKYRIGFINEYLAYYRRHDSNISSRVLKMFDSRFETLNKWRKHPSYRRAYKALFLQQMEYMAVYQKKRALYQAFRHIHYAFSLSYVKSMIKLFVYKSPR